MRKTVVAVLLAALVAWGMADAATSAAKKRAAKKRAATTQRARKAKAVKPVGKPGKRAAAIKWYTFDEGLALAKKQKKIAVVDFYADWCGWCKKMDAEVYTNGTVIALSDRVVFVKVDSDKQPAVSQKYQVQGLPTVVLLDGSGLEVKRIVGYKPAAEFAAEIRKALPT
jgi:thiol:disulfide interchange protein DsbD